MTATESTDVMRLALAGKPASHRPVWLMRQAGRYLPEYRDIRSRAGSFLTLLKTPELAAKVTLQPLSRFDLDAAILFSDILTIPDALGLELDFAPGEGPWFRHPIENPGDLARMDREFPDARLDYVPATIERIRRELPRNKPLIGFSGSPWTLACYMIGQGRAREFGDACRWLYTSPESLNELLLLLAEHIANYLIRQIEAGVDIVMLFDSWGGLLPASRYREFSLGPASVVLERIRTYQPEIPSIFFARGAGSRLEWLRDLPARCLGLDSAVPLGQARACLSGSHVLQGNLDPSALYGSTENIRAEVCRMLNEMKEESGYIVNLGHGIPPDVDCEKVGFLIDSVHEESSQRSKHRC
jgi:uroporphyrinogen decarboxylase